jgi:hypothetical protein
MRVTKNNNKLNPAGKDADPDSAKFRIRPFSV